MKKFLSRYLPVVLWAIIIFTISSQTNLPVHGSVVEDFLSKKLAHITEYFILQLLMYRAVGEISFAKSFIYSLVFSFTDEIHQLYIPTRTGKLRDVGIDAIGLTLASLLINKFQLWNSSLLVHQPKKVRK